jgi:hypothetical protein
MLGDDVMRLEPRMDFRLDFCIALLPTCIRVIKKKLFIL